MKYLAYRDGVTLLLFQFTVITIKAAPNSMKHIAYRDGVTVKDLKIADCLI
jgi:hypothetical protein